MEEKESCLSNGGTGKMAIRTTTGLEYHSRIKLCHFFMGVKMLVKLRGL